MLPNGRVEDSCGCIVLLFVLLSGVLRVQTRMQSRNKLQTTETQLKATKVPNTQTFLKCLWSPPQTRVDSRYALLFDGEGEGDVLG